MRSFKQSNIVVQFFLLFALILSTQRSAEAATINVINSAQQPSCEQVDVQSAINAAHDGDTVQIAQGSCTWAQSVAVDIQTNPRSLIIKGAGIGLTTIFDNIPDDAWGAPLFNVTTANGKAFRISGFTFKTSPNLPLTPQKYGGVIQMAGSSKAFRIDKINFDTSFLKQRGVVAGGFEYGVIDHNTFGSNVGQGVAMFHSTWGGLQYGDGSWAAPLSLGSEQAYYIEANVFNSQLVTDAFSGTRFVVRYNTIATAITPVQNHEGGSRTRGGFSWEVYNNTVTLQSGAVFMWIRSGTGVVFGNKLTAASSLTTLGNLVDLRSLEKFNPFGACDGSSPFDLNDNVVYDSGTHSGALFTETGTAPATLTANKNWTVNQWVGYSLRNTTKDWGSEILSNTANTITTRATPFAYNPAAYGVVARTWSPGDTFQILRANACLDQVGRSTGDLLSGDLAGVTPKAWLNQKLEPVYLWDNKINGVVIDKIDSNNYIIKKGREYIEGSPRPNYSPYTCPHPLISTGFTADAPEVVDSSYCTGALHPSAPTSLKIVP